MFLAYNQLGLAVTSPTSLKLCTFAKMYRLRQNDNDVVPPPVCPEHH